MALVTERTRVNHGKGTALRIANDSGRRRKVKDRRHLDFDGIQIRLRSFLRRRILQGIEPFLDLRFAEEVFRQSEFTDTLIGILPHLEFHIHIAVMVTPNHRLALVDPHGLVVLQFNGNLQVRTPSDNPGIEGIHGKPNNRTSPGKVKAGMVRPESHLDLRDFLAGDRDRNFFLDGSDGICFRRIRLCRIGLRRIRLHGIVLHGVVLCRIESSLGQSHRRLCRIDRGIEGNIRKLRFDRGRHHGAAKRERLEGVELFVKSAIQIGRIFDLGFTPELTRFHLRFVIAPCIIRILLIAFAHAERRSRTDHGVMVFKDGLVHRRRNLVQFGHVPVIKGFRAFKRLQVLHVIHRNADGELFLFSEAFLFKLQEGRLKLKDFPTFHDTGIHIGQTARRREYVCMEPGFGREQHFRGLLKLLLHGRDFQLQFMAGKLDDTGQRSFVNNLPLSILHKEQLRHTRRVDVFAVKIQVRLILERLGILGAVKTHLGHVFDSQVIVLQTERMQFLQVLRDQVARHPLVRLRSLLMTKVNLVILERESQLFRNEDALFALNRHIGNRFDNRSRLKMLKRDFEVLVTICKSKRRYKKHQRK